MCWIWSFLFLIGLNGNYIYTKEFCEDVKLKNKNCKCSNTTNPELLHHFTLTTLCTDSSKNQLKVTQGRIERRDNYVQELQIYCSSSDEELAIFDVLRYINVPEAVERLDLKGCPLSRNFRQLLLQMCDVHSISDLHVLLPISLNATMDKTYLEGFYNLSSLMIEGKTDFYRTCAITEDLLENNSKITSFYLKNCDGQIDSKPNLLNRAVGLKVAGARNGNLKEIPDGFLSNLNNLERLYLDENKLKRIENATFGSLPSLVLLRLSKNLIESIELNAFIGLTNLEKLYLIDNRLGEISSNLFTSNHKMKQIVLYGNLNLNLPGNMFSSSSKIALIELDNCNLEQLNDNVLENCLELETLRLQNNRLKQIMFLKKVPKLRLLYLADNNLEAFEAFELKHLQVLDLENNFIKRIDENSFKGLAKLEYLYLRNNKIAVFESLPFENNPRLRSIDLSQNLISNISTMDAFPRRSLRELNLSHNEITNSNIIMVDRYQYLVKIDLSFNNISEIEITYYLRQPRNELLLTANFENNQISTVTFLNEIEWPVIENSVIKLANNPIDCNCQNYNLQEFLNLQNKTRVRDFHVLEPVDLSCTSPEHLKGSQLQNLKGTEMVCDFQEMQDSKCPENCSCSYRAADAAFIFNCSDANLTELPELPWPVIPYKFNQIRIHLENNNLRTLADNGNWSYHKATELHLSYNKIEKVSWVPASLKVLHLDHNEIRSFDFQVLQTLNNSKIEDLTLEHNPWLCDCSTRNFTDFLRQQSKKVNSNVRCEGTSTLLRDLNEDSLCKSYFTIFAIVLPLCFLLTISVSFTVSYYYKEEIKVWLFANGLFLWWVTEEELDKDKDFDAFISYSHKDEDFFIENLLPVLEGGPNPYTLCLHYRNWIPGLFIPDQIAASVEASRRTVLILSQNFLDSFWGREEFRTAHFRAVSERRARIIVILYGDIDTKNLDPELKAYLNTNTYVKWGDPYFWNKLRYALPHKKQIVKKDNQEDNNEIDLELQSQEPNFANPQPVLM